MLHISIQHQLHFMDVIHLMHMVSSVKKYVKFNFISDMLRPETRSSLVLPSPTSSLSPSASSQVLPSPISSLSLLTSSQSAIISPVTSVIVRTNYLVAIAGVPIAAITIIIVFVIILCGVSYICYIKIQNERKIQLVLNYIIATITCLFVAGNLLCLLTIITLK